MYSELLKSSTSILTSLLPQRFSLPNGPVSFYFCARIVCFSRRFGLDVELRSFAFLGTLQPTAQGDRMRL
jgi:hypothetical protein